MPPIFETLLTLIPIALILAFRLIIVRKKQQESSVPGTREMEGAAAAGIAERKEPKPMGRISPAAMRATTGSVPSSARSSIITAGPGAPGGAHSERGTGARAPGSDPPAARASGANVPGTSPARRHGLSEKIEKLPPLKRAIVMSEVLGKPKSMEG